MIDDPYKVLGVSPSATPDEIKRAYRAKAKEYHPDLHPDDPNATKKMNEINEAYDMLQNPEKYRAQREQQERQQQAREQYYNPFGQNGYYYNGSQGNGDQNRGYQTYGGWTSDFNGFDFGDIFGFGNTHYDTTPHVQSSDTPSLVRAINCINSNKYSQAIEVLNSMRSQYRTDRWYYVSAYANLCTGDHQKAQDMIEHAIQMKPDNKIYRQLYSEIVDEERGETGAYSAGRSPLSGCLLRIGIILFIMLLLRSCFPVYL